VTAELIIENISTGIYPFFFFIQDKRDHRIGEQREAALSWEQCFLPPATVPTQLDTAYRQVFTASISLRAAHS